jgi:uncharacterized membrane protein
MFVERELLKRLSELSGSEGKSMDMDSGQFIGMALFVVIAVSLVPTIYTTISGTNTTGWASLTGGSGALAIFQLILLVFVCSIVIVLVKKAIG